MSETPFFNEVAAVGQQVLDQLHGRGDAPQFLLRTRDVYALLVVIHDDIVNATVDVASASTSRKPDPSSGRFITRLWKRCSAPDEGATTSKPWAVIFSSCLQAWTSSQLTRGTSSPSISASERARSPGCMSSRFTVC